MKTPTTNTLRIIYDRIAQIPSMDTMDEMTDELCYLQELLGCEPQCAEEMLCMLHGDNFMTSALQAYGFNENPMISYLSAFIDHWDDLDI